MSVPGKTSGNIPMNQPVLHPRVCRQVQVKAHRSAARPEAIRAEIRPAAYIRRLRFMPAIIC